MIYDLIEECKRTDVKVNLDWSESGEMIPRKIYWHDGRVFDVHVITKQNRPALKVGGCGVRYTVRITYKGLNLPNNITYLFFEKDAKPEVWFVEEIIPFG